jgi:hypothetical protein
VSKAVRAEVHAGKTERNTRRALLDVMTDKEAIADPHQSHIHHAIVYRSLSMK